MGHGGRSRCAYTYVHGGGGSNTARNKSSMFSTAVFLTSSASQKSIMASPIKSLISIMALKTGSICRDFC